MELIDTHAHLEGFSKKASMVENARAVGVVAVVAVSANEATCRQALDLANEYPSFVYPALGIHPQEVANNVEAALAFIDGHLDGCSAVGEIGLDYWARVDRDLQGKVFERLLDLALSRNLPVSIHSRGAWKECYEILKEKGVRKAIFHWFSGPIDVLKLVLECGYIVSATPALEYSKAHRGAIRETPLEALVLETDSPVKYRGKETEPADVTKALHNVAVLKDVSEELVASTTTENANRIFGLRL